MTWGMRLNLFQRMMLRWRELHPYNPVHVMRLPVALDPERLRACIAEQITALGLSGVVVNPRRTRIRYEGGPAAVEIEFVRAADDAAGELLRTVEREFNRPFAQGGRENPFRFAAIDENGAFRLVLAYDHFVAGGDSIARLLGAIACAYLMTGEPKAPVGPRSQPTYRNLFMRHPLWALRSILSLARTVGSARRAHRAHYGVIEDGHNAFTFLRLGPPTHGVLLATAKAWGVTLNDLLMASLMLALSPLAGQRRSETRRNGLAVASILNIRPEFGPAARDTLSPLLAAFRVVHEVPQGIGLHRLALDVHHEAARFRHGHLYLQSIIGLGASALLWPWLSVPRRQRLYPKHFPVWAGITSLNLDPIWARAGRADMARFDYLRAVPTGPLCPLVFAITRSHDVLNIGVSYRSSALSRVEVDEVIAAFMRCLGGLQDAADP